MHCSGIARGSPGVPVTLPPLVRTFKSKQPTTVDLKQNDNLVKTLTFTECDPLFEKSWLSLDCAPGILGFLLLRFSLKSG